MTILGITPEQFAQNGKAWVEGASLVLNTAIAQFGILAIAAIGVWKSIRNKTELYDKIADAKAELSQRLDNQGKRINDVALATAPTNGKTVLEQPESVEIKT